MSELSEAAVERMIESIKMLDQIITTNMEHLDGLRTTCKTEKQSTQSEIRIMESKLVSLFGRKLAEIQKASVNHVPQNLAPYLEVEKWLKIVGLSSSLIKKLTSTVKELNMNTLISKNDAAINELVLRNGGEDEEARRLRTSLGHLRRLSAQYLRGEKPSVIHHDYWDSWLPLSKSTAARTHSPTKSGTPSASPICITPTSPAIPALLIAHNDVKATPPQSPNFYKNSKGKFPTTPPPSRKNATLHIAQPHLVPYPLVKSKSHESQLANKVDNSDPPLVRPRRPEHSTSSHEGLYRGSADVQQEMPSPVGGNSPLRSPLFVIPHDDDNSKNTLIVPKSPKSGSTHRNTGTISHAINHRFAPMIKVSTCDFCHKKIALLGVKCKECKYKCHRECAEKVTPSCGLTKEMVGLVGDFFRKTADAKNPSSRSTPSPVHQRPRGPPGSNFESGSSSCTSSTPSSPACVMPPSPFSPAVIVTQFTFPDLPDVQIKGNGTGTGDSAIDVRSGEDNTDDASGLVSTTVSTESDRTLVDAVDGGTTDPQQGRADSIDSQDIDSNENSLARQSSLSVTLKEWCIPFEEIRLMKDLGPGRLGDVHRAAWHGEVAVKMLRLRNSENQESLLQAFKMEVHMLRKTRHDNLVLFMGACVKREPLYLGIVTSMCQGNTLFYHLHKRGEKFQLNKCTLIAQQIAKGMGYLHAKNILHTDLKSKNVFLEAGRVVITDFGLLQLRELCAPNRYASDQWLVYAAPEILRHLRRNQLDSSILTTATDVYAFGTILYELMTGEFPFRGVSAHELIYQVPRGLKPNFTYSSHELKDIVLQCWSLKPENRPPFSELMGMIERLPKKKLARSPSHPIQFSKSVESSF